MLKSEIGYKETWEKETAIFLTSLLTGISISYTVYCYTEVERYPMTRDTEAHNKYILKALRGEIFLLKGH